uniref:Putative secreted mucin n=1 Tax=Amblyomma triste TaxID=251400 RepID=A0A023G1L0_AMBTT
MAARHCWFGLVESSLICVIFFPSLFLIASPVSGDTQRDVTWKRAQLVTWLFHGNLISTNTSSKKPEPLPCTPCIRQSSTVSFQPAPCTKPSSSSSRMEIFCTGVAR